MPNPDYAILRISRLKSKSDLDGATRHGKREDAGTHFDPERTQYNEHFGACRNAGPVDWAAMVKAALERRGTIARKGATVAAEFFVGASPEFFAPRPWEPHFNMDRVREFADAVLSAFYDLGKTCGSARGPRAQIRRVGEIDNVFIIARLEQAK